MLKYGSSILSSSLGNILEWYDFGLFTIFSALFGRLFFSPQNPKTALLATISIFAIGFLCRPLGALIFGYLGDKYGRAKTLRISVLMIALPTLLIGILPTYQQVGLLAPCLLMLVRMWQGISIGGEYSGNLIYLAETAPARYRATFTSFASMGANFGILLATFVGIITSTYFTEQQLDSWGWRVPYLLSGLFCLFIYTYRLNIRETAVFDYLKIKHQLTSHPIKTVFQNNKFELMRTIGMVCMGTTFYYFCFVYLPIFLAESLNFSLRQISLVMTLLITCMIVFVPIAGFICDHIGRRKMLLFNAFFVAIIVVPGLHLLALNHYTLLIGILFIFTVASSLEQGTTSIAVVENFPPPARYTGVSLGYNLGNGFLGGTVPMISGWLALHIDTIAPAFYIALCALITALVVLFYVPETIGNNLAYEEKLPL